MSKAWSKGTKWQHYCLGRESGKSAITGLEKTVYIIYNDFFKRLFFQKEKNNTEFVYWFMVKAVS